MLSSNYQNPKVPYIPIRPESNRLQKASIFKKDKKPKIMSRTERNKIIIELNERRKKLPLLFISKSVISLYSWEQQKAIVNQVKITNSDLSGWNSVNDPRMGTDNIMQQCERCGLIDCPGHYGLIEFGVNKIYNPAFIRDVISVLTCVCNSCGSLLVSRDVMEQRGILKLNGDKRLSYLEKFCESLKCLKEHKRIGGGRIVSCQENPHFVTVDIKNKGEITFQYREGKKKPDKNASTYIKSIDEVKMILDSISQEDAELMGFSPGSHPTNMIMQGILVPPVIARPPLYDGGIMRPDPITSMFVTIVRKVTAKSTGQERQTDGRSQPVNLYTVVRQLIFQTDDKKGNMREFISIISRIQGKEALIRSYLMGKRNNQCGRTVAGPGSSHRFGEMGIPGKWARVLTKKIRVTNFNMNKLQRLLQEGKINSVIDRHTGLTRSFDDPSKVVLKIGDTVERALENTDPIVVNRQPSLHRQSFMGYDTVLGPHETITLHLSYTTPKNCDFDGDEVNVWNPQDPEVDAEVVHLISVKKNIMTPGQNKPSMGLVMNSITGSHLLTKSHTVKKNALVNGKQASELLAKASTYDEYYDIYKQLKEDNNLVNETRLNNELFFELTTLVTNKEDLTDLLYRLRKYGVHPRSGKAIFSAMLPRDFYYNQHGVIIYEGVMLKGQLQKKHVGNTHRSIIQDLWKKYRDQRTSDFFTDASWIVNKWLVERGFSVGILDCVSLAIDDNGKFYDKNQRIIENELAEVYVRLEALGGKLDDPEEERFRQRKINDDVNVAAGIGLRLAKKVLSGNNSIGVMTDQGAGTKGGIANIGQIMGSIGQQFYRGERLPAKLTGGTRLLPTYDMNDNNPEAHAFIPQSFFKGTTAEGLFFLQAGGREGMLDTALKVTETGTMQRRMIKAFENIVIGNDGSIRNTIGTIFEPIYNSGYDTAEMMFVKHKTHNKFASFMDIISTAEELNVARGWVPHDVNKVVISNKALSDIDKHVENILPDIGKTEIEPLVTDTSINYNINDSVQPVERPLKLSKYEKARIIGTRAMQLSYNAPPLVDIGNETEFHKIAEMEYNAGVLDLYIVRRFSDGSYIKIKPTLDHI